MLGKGHRLQQYVPWLSGEMRRNDAVSIVQAGQALSRYDARPWVGELRVPAGSLITTRDRLVRPGKQRTLARALGADVREIEADHLSAWEHPQEFAAATVDLVELVAAKSSRTTPESSVTKPPRPVESFEAPRWAPNTPHRACGVFRGTQVGTKHSTPG